MPPHPLLLWIISALFLCGIRAFLTLTTRLSKLQKTRPTLGFFPVQWPFLPTLGSSPSFALGLSEKGGWLSLHVFHPGFAHPHKVTYSFRLVLPFFLSPVFLFQQLLRLDALLRTANTPDNLFFV